MSVFGVMTVAIQMTAQTGNADRVSLRCNCANVGFGDQKGAFIEPNCVLAYNNAIILKSNFRKETRSMIAYVTVGADDMARAKRFYAAFLPALGYKLEEGPEGLSYVLPALPGQSPVLPDFYVKPTFNRRPASAGNGSNGS